MNTDDLKTTGIGTFGESGSPGLFRVEPGHSADCAFIHAAQLMACVHTLTLEAANTQNGEMMWAAHYLSGMAKALSEDMAHALVLRAD